MKLNVYTAVVILLAISAVLTGTYLAVVQFLPTASYPAYLQPIIAGLKYVFLTSAIAPLFVAIRNVSGYLSNSVSQDGPLEYEGKKLLNTWITYEGYIKGIAVLVTSLSVGTPYEQYAVWISGSAAFIIDLVRKSLTDIANGNLSLSSILSQTVQPTPTPTPSPEPTPSPAPAPSPQPKIPVTTYGTWRADKIGEQLLGKPVWIREVYIDGALDHYEQVYSPPAT